MNTTTPQDINIVPGKHECVIPTPQWFPQNTEYPPCVTAYAPLINGEQTFAAVACAIKQATLSIDYITWGFQASMYFERDKTGNTKEKMIGELLEDAAKRGVQVRVLVWFSTTGQIAAGPNFPGWQHISVDKNMSAEKTPSGVVTKEETKLTSLGEQLNYETPDQYEFDKDWHYRAAMNRIKNLTVRHREMSWIDDNQYVATRAAELPYPVDVDSGLTRKVALQLGSTHHQKMVLIDYMSPEDAVGFPMGHNTLSQYWDREDHGYRRSTNPATGRDGFTAWQDFSGCVYGETLKHMSDNFVQAWEKDVGDSAPKDERAAVKKEVFKPTPALIDKLNTRLKLDAEFPLKLVMAQICRTQSQYKAYDIFKAYMEGIKRARKYIYIENQYFRLVEIAEQIKKTANNWQACGWDPESHGSLFVFVVTNSTSDPDIISGGLQTYKMVNALGRPDVLPGYAAKHPEPESKGKKLKPEDITSIEIPGVKVHICTLVSPDSPPGKWQRTYVHSKVMLIDDTFMIQGSANINLRSMAFDSEIAIVMHDTDAVPMVKPIRKKLWNLHTNKEGADDDAKDAFDSWDSILFENTKRLKDGGIKPRAPLIKFIDLSPKLLDKD